MTSGSGSIGLVVLGPQEGSLGVGFTNGSVWGDGRVGLDVSQLGRGCGS